MNQDLMLDEELAMPRVSNPLVIDTTDAKISIGGTLVIMDFPYLQDSMRVLNLVKLADGKMALITSVQPWWGIYAVQLVSVDGRNINVTAGDQLQVFQPAPHYKTNQHKTRSQSKRLL